MPQDGVSSASFGYIPVWVGFFTISSVAGPRPLHEIVISRNRKNFAWADMALGLQTQGTDPDAIEGMVGTSTTLYVYIYNRSCLSTHSCGYAKTNDNGQTWTRLKLTCDQKTIGLTNASNDGKTLYGYIDTGAVVSSDGGISWKKLPAFPEPATVVIIHASPNGTLIARLHSPDSAQDYGVYILLPDTTQWQLLITAPSSFTDSFFTVQMDTSRKFIGIWKNLYEGYKFGVGLAFKSL
jgi:hypothetical protein